MKKEELKITIGPKGEVSILVTGVVGAECTTLTADIEKELGTVVDSQKTGDYWKDPTEDQEVYLAEGE